MNQLNNDRYWKEFKLPDLEINSYGTPTLHLRQVEAASEIDPGCETINYITRGKFNNGVKLRVIKKPNFNIIPKNMFHIVLYLFSCYFVYYLYYNICFPYIVTSNF